MCCAHKRNGSMLLGSFAYLRKTHNIDTGGQSALASQNQSDHEVIKLLLIMKAKRGASRKKQREALSQLKCNTDQFEF